MNDIAAYFDERAVTWDELYSDLSPVQGAVAAIAGIHKGSCVLDLGCGTGIMAPIYLNLNVKRAVALDIAPRMVEIAQAKFAHEPTLEFRCCDVYTYETDCKYDAVVIYNAYPHFLDKRALAQKVASLLVPKGRFVVAHSMSRQQISEHHRGVPTSVTTHLHSAKAESAHWKIWFTIDSCVDSPGFYCFAGALK